MRLPSFSLNVAVQGCCYRDIRGTSDGLVEVIAGAVVSLPV